MKKPVRKVGRYEEGGMLTSVTKAIPSWARTPIDQAYLDTMDQGSKADTSSSASQNGGQSAPSAADGKRRGGLVKHVAKKKEGRRR
jgi:hypothetical protein